MEFDHDDKSGDEKFIQTSLRSTFNYPRYHGDDDDQDQDVKKLFKSVISESFVVINLSTIIVENLLEWLCLIYFRFILKVIFGMIF